MRWDRPSSLGKTVEAKATNRPVKIAYLVPFDDAPHTHMNLDAVFFESYTRWAGVYTLVIPTKAQEFLADGYDEWLKHYDPDFIYSYVDLDAAFVDKIDRLCCPIAFLKHKEWNRKDREIDWRSFLPCWDHYIQPVSSISTVQSPASYPQFPQEERPREPTIFTQYGMEPTDRFLADNFGTGFSLRNVTHAIPGFFKILCLVPADLPGNDVAGTERCFSTLESLRAISDRKATPIARLAMVNSAGMPRPESMGWAFAFRLFIGSTPLDRIHFWNSRHLGSSWSDTSNALILEQAFFDDEQLVKQLGQYLNKNNFLGHGNGPYQTEIHSSSVAEDVLIAIRDKLQPHTWNAVHVSRSFNAPAIPSQKDLVKRIHSKTADTTTLKLTEDSSEITASEPAHFIYIPPQLRGLARGQWIVELSIQRHNNLSRYSNVIDTWTLPQRRKIARAFTERLAKPTLGGRLALVPSTEGFPFRSQVIKDTSSYEIHLPSDETFFRHLALEFFQYPADDLRAPIPRAGYIDLAVSDKGQNLRGVISLFDHMSTAFGILTNKFLRTVLAEVKEDSTKPLTFDCNKLNSLIPNDRGTIQRLTKEFRLGDIGTTKKYLRDSLKDTLDHLVRSNVFYLVAHWRCRYCGHLNSRSFDNMKIKNECDICATEYFAPIDIEWRYELNDFVYRSLQKHSGLPVLWTLGFLQDRLHTGSFWYLPEVDLYESDSDPENKNEIDILCMLDGAFHAVEVKLSASTFLNKAGSLDKFLNIIGLLRPDVALLAFEKYCAQGEDVEAMKTRLAEAASVIRKQIGPWTKLEILVAQDVAGFNDFSADLGWYGRRVREYH
jgi:rubredoxin